MPIFTRASPGPTGQIANLKSAARLFPPWPDVPNDISATITSPVTIQKSGNEATYKQAAIDWAKVALDRYPGISSS